MYHANGKQRALDEVPSPGENAREMRAEAVSCRSSRSRRRPIRLAQLAAPDAVGRALASPRRQQTTAFLRSRYVPSSPCTSPEIARLGVGDDV